METEDEGHIELVLRCLALMCDGQNKVLQVRFPEGNISFSMYLCQANRTWKIFKLQFNYEAFNWYLTWILEC